MQHPSNGAKTSRFIQNVVNGLKWSQHYGKFDPRLVMRSDSGSGKHHAENHTIPRKSRHLESNALYTRDLVQRGLAKYEKIPRAVNSADANTHPLPKSEFSQHCIRMEMAQKDEQ